MNTELAITPRNLGGVNLANFCPRCFRYLLEMRFHPPFNNFGAAIFSDLQRSQEAVIGHHLATNGKLPKEFFPFCDCVSRAEFPHSWQEYGYTHKSGVWLYGAPDEIFNLADASLCVIDLKTAHVKDKEDPFFPQYQCQVIGYADIAENGLDLGKVSKGGLMYFECQVDDVLENPANHYGRGALTVPFTPATKEIEVNYSVIDKAIEKALKIWNDKGIPEGRAGCLDCKKLELLLAIDEQFKLQDMRMMQKFGNIPEVSRALLTKDFFRNQAKREALYEMTQSGPKMFASDGLAANWEFCDGNELYSID